MKRLLCSIGILLFAQGLFAQGYINVSGGGMHVTSDGSTGSTAYVNVVGSTTETAQFHTEKQGQTENLGRIYLDGNFVNNNDNISGTLDPVLNPFKHPAPGTLFMWGNVKEQYITGKSITRFNNLTIQNLPKIQEINSLIDTGSVLTLEGELKNNEAGKRGNRMIILNIKPSAVSATEKGFVSAEADAGNTDARDAIAGEPTFEGGRLEWYISNNPNERYVFPVGHSSLPGAPRRDIEFITGTDELRKVMVRCVAKNAEDDQYVRNEAEDLNMCPNNRYFYHIIDDSISRFNKYKEMVIKYHPADGVFDDINHYEVIRPTEQWNFMDAVHDAANTKMTKENWDNYEWPVFALGLVKPLKEITANCVPPKVPCEPRVGDQLQFEDNPENKPYFMYEWIANYVNPKEPPKNNVIIGKSSIRKPLFPDDFQLLTPWTEYRAAEIKFELRITNPNNPDCFEVDDTTILFKPRRATYIPNGFTPDESSVNTLNNDWVAYLYGFEEATVSIYNRWGLEIFKKTYTTKDGVDSPTGVKLWDGRTTNGEWVPEGAYVYKLEMVSNEENTLDKFWQSTGTVTVVR